MRNKRVVIVGVPLGGKSNLAATLGLPVYCTDMKSNAREIKEGVTYLEEGFDWSAQSQHISDHWFKMPGPWVIEGVAAVRALRKWYKNNEEGDPCDEIILISQFHPEAVIGNHRPMAKAVLKIWSEFQHEVCVPLTIIDYADTAAPVE